MVGRRIWTSTLKVLLVLAPPRREKARKKKKNSIRARDEAAAKLYTQLGRICDAIEKRSIILARNDDCSYSIAKVMDMLRSKHAWNRDRKWAYLGSH